MMLYFEKLYFIKKYNNYNAELFKKLEKTKL